MQEVMLQQLTFAYQQQKWVESTQVSFCLKKKFQQEEHKEIQLET